jgi:single-strand DNA-binding protein
MRCLNEVNLIGRVGNEPEIKQTDSVLIARISVATDFISKRTGSRERQTEWHSVVAFGKLAEIVQKYIKKGSSVYIKGSLKTNNWTDNQGVKRYKTEVVAQDLMMLHYKEMPSVDASASHESVPDDEEMPF